VSKYIENKYKLIDRLIEEEKKLSNTDPTELMLKAPLQGNLLIQLGHIQSIKVYLEEKGEILVIPDKYNDYLKMLIELFYIDKDDELVYTPTKAKLKDLIDGIKLKKEYDNKGNREEGK
jgi:phosphomannomutase